VVKTEQPKIAIQNEHKIKNFAALKSSIVNSEEQSVKELLGNQTMQELEKS